MVLYPRAAGWALAHQKYKPAARAALTQPGTTPPMPTTPLPMTRY